MVAILIAPDHLQRARQTVNQLRLRGQNRIHFTKERPDRRRQILRAILQLDMTIEIYEVSQSDIFTERHARNTCLQQLLTRMLTNQTSYLVLEIDTSMSNLDRQQIIRATLIHPYPNSLRYALLTAREEPLLALPDAIAWCWSRGGIWKKIILESERSVHHWRGEK